MEEQSKDTDISRSDTSSMTDAVTQAGSDTDKANQPVVSELRPDEWFRSDSHPESVNSSKLPPKRAVLITGGIILGIAVMGIGLVVATKNMTKEQLVSEEANTQASKDSSSSSVDTAGETPEEPASDQPAEQQGQQASVTGDGSVPSSGDSTSGQTGTTSDAGVHTMGYTFSGCYTPQDITIKAGDTIHFVNNDVRKDMWPASDNHPTHKIYSEFDARNAVTPGGSYSFAFTKVGSWRYHDHIKSSCSGTITVQ